jgi:hypothetical protein
MLAIEFLREDSAPRKPDDVGRPNSNCVEEAGKAMSVICRVEIAERVG